MKVPAAFKVDFDAVHAAFGTAAAELMDEKERIARSGEVTADAQAYYAATAALIRAGWNPTAQRHVALWRGAGQRGQGADA